jgi:hypothetical protein
VSGIEALPAASMSGWVKWEKDLETDPRFVRLVRHVRNRCVTDASHAALATSITAGALLRFWVYADTHIREKDQLDLGLEDIDDLVGLPGFSEGMSEDWLVVIDDSTVELPGYQEHNGVEARKRDLTQKRMQRKRLRDSDATVTQQRNASVTGASPDQTRPDQTKTKKNTTAASRPTKNEFEAFKAIYPKRGGSQPWSRALKAINARLGEGHTWDQILDGARRYKAFCRATGKERTEYVLQAATFCGPDKRFLEPWAAPATKADVRQRSNQDAFAAAKQKLRGGT